MDFIIVVLGIIVSLTYSLTFMLLIEGKTNIYITSYIFPFLIKQEKYYIGPIESPICPEYVKTTYLPLLTTTVLILSIIGLIIFYKKKTKKLNEASSSKDNEEQH